MKKKVAPAGPVTIVDFSSAAQGVNADPWPAFVLTLSGAENKIVAMVAHIGAQTYDVTAAGIAMVAGPTAGPADGTNGFVRSCYLDRATVGGELASCRQYQYRRKSERRRWPWRLRSLGISECFRRRAQSQ